MTVAVVERRKRRKRTIRCGEEGCDEPIVLMFRIQWHGLRKDCVRWRLTEDGWETDPPEGVCDEGSHIHLCCAATVRHEEADCGYGCAPYLHCLVPSHKAGCLGIGKTCEKGWGPSPDHIDHEFKLWPHELPPVLRHAVFPGEPR